jgi:hypothetical protein
MFSFCSKMQTAAALSATPDPAVPDGADDAWARAMLDRQLRILGDLAEIGLELARAVEAEAKAGAIGLDAAMLAYARTSRAVRQTILLQSRLIHDLRSGADPAEAARPRPAEVMARVRGILDKAIEAEHEAPERIERLKAEAAERLEAEDFGDGLDRSVADIVADICHALGLEPDWMGLVADINAAEAFASSQRDRSSGEPEPIEVQWMDCLRRPGSDSS